MKKMMIILAALVVLAGCDSADRYTASDYGFEYDSETTMGIKVRVDDGGVMLNHGRLDYYFASVMNCVGRRFDPESLIIISTAEDANSDIVEVVEGWAWPIEEYEDRFGVKNPAMIVLNSTGNPGLRYQLLSHELVHVFTGVYSHDHEAFERCGWRVY